MECIKCAADVPEGAVFCPWCGKKQVTVPAKKYHKRANGSGCIFKLKGKRARPWAARRNGILVGTYATRGEAQKALERITDADINDRWNLTFSGVFTRWSEIHFREISHSQANTYSAAFKGCPELHGKKFRSLTKADFQEQIVKREKAGYSLSSCEKMIQLFSAMSAWAEDNGIVPKSHATRLRTVAKQKSFGVCLTSEQIQAIRDCDLPAKEVALIMLATGCRPGEIFTVSLADCHDDYFVGGSKTDEGRDRLIVVSSIGLDAYRSMRDSARATGGRLLIDGYRGNRKPENYAKRDFRKMMDTLHIEGITPGDLRHTYATMLAKSHVPPQLVRRLMGHSNIHTADKHYTHMDLEDLQEGSRMIFWDA